MKFFADSPLSIGERGDVIAQYFRRRITSAFLPLVRAHDGAVAGHHARLQVQGPAGEDIAPASVHAEAGDDPARVKLDRLCRTVHALNYFPSADADASLFIDLDGRLLTDVTADQGAFHDSVLALIGVAPGRVVIVMPPESVDDPAAFVRAAISYRIRGYRVLVPLRSFIDVELSHVLHAEPHYVALDTPDALDGAAECGFLATLAKRGMHLVARGIRNEAQAAAARDAGAQLLQGAM